MAEQTEVIVRYPTGMTEEDKDSLYKEVIGNIEKLKGRIVEGEPIEEIHVVLVGTRLVVEGIEHFTTQLSTVIDRKEVTFKSLDD
jgi:hypothetical protein